jgi:hypothetical protein
MFILATQTMERGRGEGKIKEKRKKKKHTNPPTPKNKNKKTKQNKPAVEIKNEVRFQIINFFRAFSCNFRSFHTLCN